VASAKRFSTRARDRCRDAAWFLDRALNVETVVDEADRELEFVCTCAWRPGVLTRSEASSVKAMTV
jgi:hypothetical protein